MRITPDTLSPDQPEKTHLGLKEKGLTLCSSRAEAQSCGVWDFGRPEGPMSAALLSNCPSRSLSQARVPAFSSQIGELPPQDVRAPEAGCGSSSGHPHSPGLRVIPALKRGMDASRSTKPVSLTGHCRVLGYEESWAASRLPNSNCDMHTEVVRYSQAFANVT
jgi:hypothetical protein